jgi:hypothetical protein
MWIIEHLFPAFIQRQKDRGVLQYDATLNRRQQHVLCLAKVSVALDPINSSVINFLSYAPPASFKRCLVAQSCSAHFISQLRGKKYEKRRISKGLLSWPTFDKPSPIHQRDWECLACIDSHKSYLSLHCSSLNQITGHGLESRESFQSRPWSVCPTV